MQHLFENGINLCFQLAQIRKSQKNHHKTAHDEDRIECQLRKITIGTN